MNQAQRNIAKLIDSTLSTARTSIEFRSVTAIDLAIASALAEVTAKGTK